MPRTGHTGVSVFTIDFMVQVLPIAVAFGVLCCAYCCIPIRTIHPMSSSRLKRKPHCIQPVLSAHSRAVHDPHIHRSVALSSGVSHSNVDVRACPPLDPDATTSSNNESNTIDSAGTEEESFLDSFKWPNWLRHRMETESMDHATSLEQSSVLLDTAPTTDSSSSQQAISHCTEYAMDSNHPSPFVKCASEKWYQYS
jgi:hypothetical protein